VCPYIIDKPILTNVGEVQNFVCISVCNESLFLYSNCLMSRNARNIVQNVMSDAYMIERSVEYIKCKTKCINTYDNRIFPSTPRSPK
jgi:hypothetical protein